MTNRTPQLVTQLTAVWADSVRATHHFLTEDEILKIKLQVPNAIASVAHLVIATAEQPVAFMGINGRKLEMLFIAPAQRGQGLGRQLLQYGIAHYQVNELTVNEQNPAAIGFYAHLGFRTYRRTTVDEAGAPYPLLFMRR
ncbi:acetyltransferase, GNAT family [Lactobacillus selangorensis]|uniref:Acetyltransferase, GNAT family n=1 Tax=Lactobacillus selangorensis TaxID=81857 RepID=A0A0R2GAS9_9LACO|nr:acetyltransferase, GNAT family [Lactobacillus selangorensis]KRN33908.1 acetyltransferase, GNAT family [Lactobacillus selangorensis]